MKRWLHTFTVEGLNLERFLRNVGESGIQIAAIRRSGRCIRAAADEGDIRKIEEIALQGGWRFELGACQGAGQLLERGQRRWMLVAGIALTLLLMVLGTQVMWAIDVVDAGTYEADIRIAIDEMGIRAPMLRRRISLGALRDALEWRYPKIAWIECGWRGMVLQIRVVEGVPPDGREAVDGTCDVVASRDGIVSGIVTRAGTPAVKPGDLVRKGQVLIRGEERTSGGETKPVTAQGSVYARVWDAASVKMPVREVMTVYTGRQQQSLTIRTPWFDLWRMESSVFEQQDTAIREITLGGFFLPFVLHEETRMEADFHIENRDWETLKEDSGRAAMQKLCEIAGGKESLVDNWVNWSMIEDEILLSVAYGERLLDIAQQERDPVMAAAE